MTTERQRDFLTAIEHSHGPGLRRFLATRLRQSATDIQDITQEVFLRMLRIDNHEAIRNPQAYLYTVASHVAHQYMLKRSEVAAANHADDIAADLQSRAAIDPATQAELEQRYEELGRGLEKLSPRAYATLVMHRCDGVPLDEVATQLGVSYTMAKRYLAKALVYCRQRLDEMETE